MVAQQDDGDGGERSDAQIANTSPVRPEAIDDQATGRDVVDAGGSVPRAVETVDPEVEAPDPFVSEYDRGSDGCRRAKDDGGKEGRAETSPVFSLQMLAKAGDVCHRGHCKRLAVGEEGVG